MLILCAVVAHSSAFGAPGSVGVAALMGGGVVSPPVLLGKHGRGASPSGRQ